MAIITVVGGGGSSGSIPATSASQWVVSTAGGPGSAGTCVIYNSTYSGSNSTTFADLWEITVPGNSVAGGIGLDGNTNGYAQIAYPIGAKYYDWYIRGGAGYGGPKGVAGSSATSRGNGGTDSFQFSGAPVLYSYAKRQRPAQSYATSTTFGFQACVGSPLTGLFPPYGPYADENPPVQLIFSTTTAADVWDGPGSGGRSVVRLGVGTARVGAVGYYGLVHISWWG